MYRSAQYLWYPLLLASAMAMFVLLRAMDTNLLTTTSLPILITGAALVALEWARPARVSWRPSRDEVWSDALYMLGVPLTGCAHHRWGGCVPEPTKRCAPGRAHAASAKRSSRWCRSIIARALPSTSTPAC